MEQSVSLIKTTLESNNQKHLLIKVICSLYSNYMVVVVIKWHLHLMIFHVVLEAL